MNLFDSIGLKSDPFSTSPNVELFYPAAHHRQCLEGLELAIRMRRGLSVVRGGIGVGKTTVSRKLIQNFKKESDDFDFYLILDPKFESEIILLQHIIELFGVDEKGDSVQACRNIIENCMMRNKKWSHCFIIHFCVIKINNSLRTYHLVPKIKISRFICIVHFSYIF